MRFDELVKRAISASDSLEQIVAMLRREGFELAEVAFADHFGPLHEEDAEANPHWRQIGEDIEALPTN